MIPLVCTQNFGYSDPVEREVCFADKHEEETSSMVAQIKKNKDF